MFGDNGFMSNQSIVPSDIAARFEVHEWRNGLAILSAAHSSEWVNIVEVLKGFTLLRSDVLKPGGSKGLIASRLDSHFTKLGWVEKKFETKIVVDKEEHVTPTHKVASGRHAPSSAHTLGLCHPWHISSCRTIRQFTWRRTLRTPQYAFTARPVGH